MGVDVDFDFSNFIVETTFEYGFLFLLELNGNINLGLNIFDESVTWEVSLPRSDTNMYITIFATLESSIEIESELIVFLSAGISNTTMSFGFQDGEPIFNFENLFDNIYTEYGIESRNTSNGNCLAIDIAPEVVLTIGVRVEGVAEARVVFTNEFPSSVDVQNV